MVLWCCARSLTCGVACHLNSIPIPDRLATMAAVSAAANESTEAVTVLVAAVSKVQCYSSQVVVGALDARAYHCCSWGAEGSSCLA